MNTEIEENDFESLSKDALIDYIKDLENRVEANEKRYNKYMDEEESHYEEYKYFEKRTVTFQESFPYDQMNWLGKLILWFICKKRK